MAQTKKPKPLEVSTEELAAKLKAAEETKRKEAADAFFQEYVHLCKRYNVDRVTDAITTVGGVIMERKQIIVWNQ